MAKTYEISDEDKEVYRDLVENPPLSPDFAKMGAINPNLRVIAINFDGTWNDKDKIPTGERPTIVAQTHDKIKAIENDTLVSRYYKGVGTAKGLVGSAFGLVNLIEGVTGKGCVRNAEQAHADVVAQVQKWREENPDVQVHVHVTSFSRGGVSALHLMNLIHERGALAKGTDPKSALGVAPGNVKTSAVLIDTVTTGQEKYANLAAPDTATSIACLVAGGEERDSFKVRKVGDEPNAEISYGSGATLKDAPQVPGTKGMFLYQRIREYVLPGARHSDAGGSYGEGNIREISAYLVDRFIQSMGIPIRPVKPDDPHIEGVRFHDSRWGYEKFFHRKNQAQLQVVNERQEAPAVVEAREHLVVVTTLKCSGVSNAGPSTKITPDYLLDLKSKDPSVEPSLKYLGKLHEVTLEFENGVPKLLAAKDSPFHIQDGRLMFSDWNLPDIPSAADLLKHTQQRAKDGLPPEPIQISMDYRRHGITHQTSQNVEMMLQNRLSQVVDEDLMVSPAPIASNPVKSSWVSLIRGVITRAPDEPKQADALSPSRQAAPALPVMFGALKSLIDGSHEPRVPTQSSRLRF